MRVTRQRVVLSGLTIALLAAAGTYLVAELLERTLREPVNNYIRDHTLAFLQERSIEGLSINFPSLDLSLLHRRLLIRDLLVRYEHRDSARTVRFRASVPLITLDGLDLSDVVWHRHLRLDAVRLQRPVLSNYRETADTAARGSPAGARQEASAEPDSLAPQVPALDSVVYNLVAFWLPEDLRQARIDLVEASGASIVFTANRGGRSNRDSTDGLALRIRGIALDSARHRVFESAEAEIASLFHVAEGLRDSVRIEGVTLRLDGRDTVITARSIRTIPADSGHALFLGGLRRSNREGTFSLDTLAYAPLLPDLAYFRRRPGRSRVQVSLRGVQGTGVETDVLFRRHATVGRIDIDTARLDVLADTRTAPRAPRVRPLWPQVLASLKWGLQVDTLSVGRGLVRYGELTPGRPQPAAIWFSGIAATVTGISNERGHGGLREPVVLAATARFMGQGALSTRLEVPVTSRTFSMKGEGRLEPMPAAALNPFLLTSEGIRVTSGLIHAATFHFRVSSGTAVGKFSLVYDSMAVEVVDRATRKKGVDEKIKTFVANNLVLRPSSLPDRQGRAPSAPILYRYPAGESFWGGIWRSLRSGIIPLVKKSASSPPRRTRRGE